MATGGASPAAGSWISQKPSPPIAFDFFGKKSTPTDRVLIGATTSVAGHEVRLLNVHLLAFFMLGSSSSEHSGQRDLIAGQLAAAVVAVLLLRGPQTAAELRTRTERLFRLAAGESPYERTHPKPRAVRPQS